MKLSPRQTLAWEVYEQDDVQEVLYGGAKGGGKSVFLCYRAYVDAIEVIRKLKLQPREHPIPISWMGRQQGIDFKTTTLETWKRFIPSSAYELRTGDQEIVIGGAVKICYGGLDRTESIQKFNSAEFLYIYVDQAEEVSKDNISVLRASRRLKIDGVALPVKALWTANPRQCWLKTDFIDQPTADRRFIPALPSDNPFLEESYIRILEDAFRHRPELLEAYLYGSWDAFEGVDQILSAAWIRQARERKLHRPEKKRLLVCDVARFGDDLTVMYYMEDTDIVEARQYGKKDTMHTANLLHVLAVEKDVHDIGIDTCGIGGGVADRLEEMSNGQYKVHHINSAAASSRPDRYANLRAEIWDNAAQMFNDGEIDMTFEDPELTTELTTACYKFRNGKILVEPKEDIKNAARLGRSPDKADTYVMGLYMLAQVEGDRARKRRLNKDVRDPYARTRKRRSAMAM